MNNVLITKTGETIDCPTAGLHAIECMRKLGIKLRTFLLKRDGIRVKIGWPDAMAIAIEYYHKPTEPQMRIIRRILRQADYYTVILNLRTISKFRPIRGFQP